MRLVKAVRLGAVGAAMLLAGFPNFVLAEENDPLCVTPEEYVVAVLKLAPEAGPLEELVRLTGEEAKAFAQVTGFPWEVDEIVTFVNPLENTASVPMRGGCMVNLKDGGITTDANSMEEGSTMIGPRDIFEMFMGQVKGAVHGHGL